MADRCGKLSGMAIAVVAEKNQSTDAARKDQNPGADTDTAPDIDTDAAPDFSLKTPPNGLFTASDLDNTRDDGCRYEVIEGRIIVPSLYVRADSEESHVACRPSNPVSSGSFRSAIRVSS